MTAPSRLPLRRAPRFHEDDEPRYWHPNGWVIFRDTREWDWPRGSAGWSPKVTWGVKRIRSSSPKREYFRTLREARAWCDEHESWP